MNDGTDSKINVLRFSIDLLLKWMLPGVVGLSPSEDLLGFDEMNLTSRVYYQFCQ